MLVLSGTVAAVVVLLGAWFATRPGSTVTEGQARAYFDRIVAAARTGDFDAMCNLNGAPPNCQLMLDVAGRDRVPADPPRVSRARYASELDTPGWLLVVEGLDGRARPYSTQVLIFRDDEGELKAINAVYWSGATVSDGSGPSSPSHSP